jgi:neutral ceramidase
VQQVLTNYAVAFQKFIKYTFYLAAGLALLLFLFLDRVDRRPYQEMEYYTRMQEELQQLPDHAPEPEAQPIKAGWAKQNITPDVPKTFSGYGLRKKYTAVKDSIWARTFVFDNGQSRAAIVTLDLLIVPPVVVKQVHEMLATHDIALDNIYYTATHTHSSAGGWAKNPGGMAIAGTYDDAYVNKISSAICQAIQAALSSQEEATLGFARFNSSGLVYNRLDHEGSLDPWLNVIKIRKASGATAVLASFSAHATCINIENEHLTRDYPGILVDSLERASAIDFAAFGSGAVASHAPAHLSDNMYEKATLLADSLSGRIVAGFERIPLEKTSLIRSLYVPLHLREPHFKIAENWRLRPWVFNMLMGRYGAGINVLRLGNTVMVGTPCDFSGELTSAFDSLAQDKGFNVMVTSFNGGYIGYITHDRHYDLPRPETREMNWFGPYNGAYFTEIITELLRKI